MADYLNKYANDGTGAGGYNNADEQSARAALGNTVSLVESTGEVHYDGVSVERPANNPMEGDVLYLDANGGKHYIDQESLTSVPEK